ncbi:prealbumin-like fold domain-containing protein [Enterococcus faecalis]|uniref:prealbumin-like fold domain-containing protein n=1 Tax=Enterococcus TaxID=1350 RepID=UPI000A676F50|nr:SpaA isopeptide-forming pilin-related protein [Enterococcus faecalis]
MRNASGEVLKSGLVTDKEGVLLLEGLEQGSYQLVKTKAPEGYTLDSTPVVFTLNAETMITKYNSKEIKDTSVNPTDKKDTPTTGPKSPGTKNNPLKKLQ